MIPWDEFWTVMLQMLLGVGALGVLGLLLVLGLIYLLERFWF
jgi:hypothetical protein